MNFSTLLAYAVRDVIKSRVILFLIVTSLSIAFASVFLSTSILQGFRFILVDGAKGYLADLVITPANDKQSLPRLEAIQQAISAIRTVAALSVRSDAFLSIEFNEKTVTPYRTVGVDPISEAQTTQLADRIIEGRFLTPQDQGAAVLGLTLADFLVGLDYDGQRIKVGEKIDVIGVDGKKKTYPIVGIIDAKSFLPNLFLILPDKELKGFKDSKQNHELVVRLDNPNTLTQTQHAIEDATSDVDVVPWNKQAGYVDDIVNAVTFIMGLIRVLLTASVFLIMSIIIFINVFQKRRQIGIMKSMGTSNAFIVTIYVLEALIYAVLSAVIGFFLFWTIHSYSLKHPVSMLIGDFHTVFEAQTIWVSISILLTAALAGSVIPAYLAARTKIVDVIRDSV